MSVSDDVVPMHSKRLGPGSYLVLGTSQEVTVERVVYPNDGVYWALVVNGVADDIYATKREALQAAQTRADI